MASVATKKVCPVSREQFHSSAESFVVSGGSVQMLCEPREFQSKSIGWGFNGKCVVKLKDGTLIPCQVGLNIVAIGSKPEGGAA